MHLDSLYRTTYCWPPTPGAGTDPLIERDCDGGATPASAPLEIVGIVAELEEAFLRMPLGLGLDADRGSGVRWGGSGIISTLMLECLSQSC
jgi:hypothetical protein